MVYNVRDYGATGDGKTLDSPAINRAIDACAKAGGGTVCLPAGTYLSGSIHLKSNINLLIDAGATILGAPQEMKAYDPAEPFEGTAYQDGGHTYFHNSLIWGENLTNVSITGQGMINGGGLTRSDKAVGAGPINTGDKAIALKLCRNVLLRDFTIFHGGHFAVLVTGCDNMTIDNVTMDTNRDGLDIDCCRNVMVSNCRINSPERRRALPEKLLRPGQTGDYGESDDRQLPGLRIRGRHSAGRPDAAQQKTRMAGSNSAPSRTADSAISPSPTAPRAIAVGIALEEVDGGIMENISISNITMMDVAAYPIYITLGRRNRGPEGTPVGTARNISISNVIATGIEPMSGIQITGLPGHYVEGVRLENIRLDFQRRRDEERRRTRFRRNWIQVIRNPAKSASCPLTEFSPVMSAIWNWRTSA